MFLVKMNDMGWFILRLLQVPNLEIFSLVDCEELTDTGRKLRLVRVGRQHNFVFLAFFLLSFSFVKVKQAPFKGSDGSLTFLIPDCQRRCILFVVEANGATGVSGEQIAFVAKRDGGWRVKAHSVHLYRFLTSLFIHHFLIYFK